MSVDDGGGGCGCGCGSIIAVLFLISIAGVLLAALIYLILGGICVAAGVGLWFLIRWVWRTWATDHPFGAVVELGMSMSPTTRKVVAGIICAVVAFALMFHMIIAL